MVHSNAGSAVTPARGRTERASSIWQDRRLGIALAIGIAVYVIAGAFTDFAERTAVAKLPLSVRVAALVRIR